MRNVVVVGGDPGGAAALLPVLRALRDQAIYRLRILAYRHAVTVWRNAGMHVERLAEDTPVDPGEILRRDDVSLLLTGTSLNGVDHERSFLRWASDESVPSIALLDFWTNYEARFRDAQRGELVIPSFIAVMDRSAVLAMTAAGFPAGRLVVTGQPSFDTVATVRESWTSADRRGVRESLSIAAGDARLVLFVSQPLSEMAELSGRASCFDERGVLAAVIQALDAIALSAGTQIVLAIRPHPRESPEPGILPPSDNIRVIVDVSDEPLRSVLAADLVIGMNSVLLIQAALAGSVVLSVQPGGEASDPLASNRSGATVPVYEWSRLPETLRRYLFDEEVRVQVRRLGADIVQSDATQRVVALIDKTMRTRSKT